MNRPYPRRVSAAAFCASIVTSLSAIAGQDLLVLTSDNEFFRVEIDSDGTFESGSPMAIGGLSGGETVRSIAIDPATGHLLAITSADRCCIVDKTTGLTTDLGSLVAAQSDDARFLDVDPQSGHLRVQGNLATNLELDPDTLAIELIGFAPSFGAGDVNQGALPSLAGSAFTNSYPGSVVSQAYAIDVENDVLAYHSTLNGDLYTIGELGIDATLDAGMAFDLGGRMFAVVRAEGETASRLYSANPETGALTDLGSLGDGIVANDIAFDLDPTSDDLDGDGWPNDVEIAGAANFADPNSSPFPSATKVPSLTMAPALSQKLRVKLRFADPSDQGDRIVVKGKLPIAESTFAPAGKTLIVDIGGVTAFFVLDAKGRGTSAHGFTIDLENTVGLGGVKFKLVMNDGAFQSAFQDEGLVEADVVDVPKSIQVDFWMSNLHARESVAVEYSAVVGGEGFAH